MYVWVLLKAVIRAAPGAFLSCPHVYVYTLFTLLCLCFMGE